MNVKKKKSKKRAGRPTEVKTGRAVNVYLDNKSINKAKRLGNGSLSRGIRLALNKA